MRRGVPGPVPIGEYGGVAPLVRLALAAVFTTVLASGCAGPVDPTAQPRARQLTPADAPGLFVVESRALGPIVVDGRGFALYRRQRFPDDGASSISESGDLDH